LALPGLDRRRAVFFTALAACRSSKLKRGNNSET
jgi:hypothetical protein